MVQYHVKNAPHPGQAESGEAAVINYAKQRRTPAVASNTDENLWAPPAARCMVLSSCTLRCVS